MPPIRNRDESCPYCGSTVSSESARSSCAVCGMAIPHGHWPHILRFDPDSSPVHFCSLTCMENYEALPEATDDA